MWIKIASVAFNAILLLVTSFTLVWIKIHLSARLGLTLSRHELHARVD